MADWIVGSVNCTATPGNVACVLDDTGGGLGGLFDGIAIPIMTMVILLGVATGVGAILYGVAKKVGST